MKGGGSVGSLGVRGRRVLISLYRIGVVCLPWRFHNTRCCTLGTFPLRFGGSRPPILLVILLSAALSSFQDLACLEFSIWSRLSPCIHFAGENLYRLVAGETNQWYLITRLVMRAAKFRPFIPQTLVFSLHSIQTTDCFRCSFEFSHSLILSFSYSQLPVFSLDDVEVNTVHQVLPTGSVVSITYPDILHWPENVHILTWFHPFLQFLQSATRCGRLGLEGASHCLTEDLRLFTSMKILQLDARTYTGLQMQIMYQVVK